MSVSYFLDQAKRARAVAEQMRDPVAKRVMLGIAERYESLAGAPFVAPSEEATPEQPEKV